MRKQMTIKYCNCPRNIPYHNKDCEFYVPPTTPIPEGALDVTTYWGNQIHQLNIEIINLRAALVAEQARTKQLAGALRSLYEDTKSYIEVNHLGDVHHNQSMKLADAALASHPTQAENKNTTKEKI
jgi:hypothetical protein